MESVPDRWYERWMDGRRRLVERAVAGLPSMSGGIVLDVAAGDGEFSAIVAERIGGRVVAHDWAAAECRASQAAGLSGVRGDARRLPFADRIADVTVAFEIVEHFSKSAGLSVIDELHRVTKPNGTLLLSTPNRYALESFKGLARYFRDGTIWNARDETHVKLYSRRELISALRPRFDVVRSYGYYLFEAGRLPIPGSHTITANALLANLCFILFVVATPKPDCADHRTAQVAGESLRVRPEAEGVDEVSITRARGAGLRSRFRVG